MIKCIRFKTGERTSHLMKMNFDCGWLKKMNKSHSKQRTWVETSFFPHKQRLRSFMNESDAKETSKKKIAVNMLNRIIRPTPARCRSFNCTANVANTFTPSAPSIYVVVWYDSFVVYSVFNASRKTNGNECISTNRLSHAEKKGRGIMMSMEGCCVGTKAIIKRSYILVGLACKISDLL